MYLSTTRAADAARTTSEGPVVRRQLPATVIALGLVSLVTDASAEMVTAVLPLYLIYGLGLGYLQVGALDGLYTGATALLRLAGGYTADKLKNHKAVAVSGYGLSALTKLGLPLAGSSLGAISGLVAVDRAGKGIRTAPRDALISLTTPAPALGRAFGVHRALDTAGALLGPLLAFALLAAIPGAYDTVFVASFCLAAIGVLILLFFVRQPQTDLIGRPAVNLRAAAAAAMQPGVRRLLLSAVLLGVLTVGDMFLYVALQRQTSLPTGLLPLLPLGSALVFMAAAVPLGRLADRVGRWKMFALAHVALLVAYLVLAGGEGGWVAAAGILVLHGLFYAASDGVLMATAGPVIPAEVRTSGLAVIQTGQALARAIGAVGFGVAAATAGVGITFLGYAGLLAVAVVIALRMASR